MTQTPRHAGWIEVITGSMFSGKSEELIRRLRRAQIARQRVAIFKPQIDDRFSTDEIVSHNQQRIPSIPVAAAGDITKLATEADVIGVDEAQFFDLEIVSVTNDLADGGKRVVVAGLDKDFRGLPFGAMPLLMTHAEYVTKTLAICMQCGEPANFTQRLTQDAEQIVLGEMDKYEARCRRCFEPPPSATNSNERGDA